MAHKKTSVIEINGRRYDAQTGSLLSGNSQPLQITITEPAKTISHAVKVDRQPTQHAKVHSPQKSQTLMRQSVSKPQKADRRQYRVQTNTGLTASVPSLVTPKLSVLQVHPGRLQRARNISKNSLIQHYSATAASKAGTTERQTGPLPSVVKKSPVHTTEQAPVKQASHAVFERALAQATAHEQQPYNPKQHAREQRKHARHLKRIAKPFYRRASTVTMVSLSVLAIAGLVALQYRPVLTLQVANARAGFNASLPGFRPAGYNYGSITYSHGLVGIQFKSDAADRSFNLKQQLSDWDNQTLLQSQVMNVSHYYQALKVSGHTVYVYGQNNASWLDKGVLYNLNSNGSLSTNDILNIASSI